jgi:hypothetical protein
LGVPKSFDPAQGKAVTGPGKELTSLLTV